MDTPVGTLYIHIIVNLTCPAEPTRPSVNIAREVKAVGSQVKKLTRVRSVENLFMKGRERPRVFTVLRGSVSNKYDNERIKKGNKLTLVI